MARWGCRRTRSVPTRSTVIGPAAENTDGRYSLVARIGVPGPKIGVCCHVALARLGFGLELCCANRDCFFDGNSFISRQVFSADNALLIAVLRAGEAHPPPGTQAIGGRRIDIAVQCHVGARPRRRQGFGQTCVLGGIDNQPATRAQAAIAGEGCADGRDQQNENENQPTHSSESSTGA